MPGRSNPLRISDSRRFADPHFFIFPAHQTLHASFAGASWRLEAIGSVSSLQRVPRLPSTSDKGLRRPPRNQPVGDGDAQPLSRRSVSQSCPRLTLAKTGTERVEGLTPAGPKKLLPGPV